MPNHKSAIKRMRQNTKRHEHNRAIKSRLRTHVAQFEEALETGDVATAEEAFRTAEAALDRASAKGIIPASRAARKTSRLARRLHALSVSQ